MRSSSNLKLITIFILSMCCGICIAHNAPQDYLDAHNKVRAEVGVGPLTWNDTLAACAENYAKTRVKDFKMEHSGGPYGENIAASSGEMNAADAVKLWVDEKPNYDHDTNCCVNDGAECRHYTQVVWRDTARLGCANAKCDNGWTFVVCNYDPPGNYQDQQPY